MFWPLPYANVNGSTIVLHQGKGKRGREGEEREENEREEKEGEEKKEGGQIYDPMAWKCMPNVKIYLIHTHTHVYTHTHTYVYTQTYVHTNRQTLITT